MDANADLNGLLAVTTHRGRETYDNTQGSAGTVYTEIAGIGTLIIDDNETGQTAAIGTPLPLLGPGITAAATVDGLTTDGRVALLPGALVGLRLNPNLDQAETFAIAGNTAGGLTLVTPNEHGVAFANVAGAGRGYGLVYTWPNLLLRRGGHLEVGDRLQVTDDLDITDHGLLTHPETSRTYAGRLDLTAARLHIAATGRIDVTGRGHVGGVSGVDGGHGQSLGFTSGSPAGTGGSHGGLGGRYSGVAASDAPNPAYDSITDPRELGSGGGQWSGVAGGDGGGLLLIEAGVIENDGVIRADGATSGGSAGGSGSGGSVNLRVDTLSGAGTITANGGGASTAVPSVGGGGGRVAIRYTASQTLPLGNIRSLGGLGVYGNGGHGTLHLRGPGQVYGDLIIDGQGVTQPGDSVRIEGGQVFDNLRLTGGARVVADDGISVLGELRIGANAVLTHGQGNAAGLRIETARLVVEAGGAIDVTGRGYLGGVSGVDGGHGQTLGFTSGSPAGTGGSHGGLGGRYYGIADVASPAYDNTADPRELGGGGGQWSGVAGGNGGGLLLIDAGVIENDGVISADGATSGGSAGGSGSGGSVNLRVDTLSGAGTITANGGGASTAVPNVGGGGGRIAIHYTASPTLPLANIRSLGGLGVYGNGGHGTVHLRGPGQAHGDLIIDGQGLTQPGDSVRIEGGQVFDNLRLTGGARVVADDGISVLGELRIGANAVLTHGQGNAAGLRIETARLVVEAGGGIDVTGRGYAGGVSGGYGQTLNGQPGAQPGAGGSYGGRGALYSGGNRVTNPVYGDPRRPDALGSGGGQWSGQVGGNGGGRVDIIASDAVRLDGAIRADGATSGGSAAGSGSGGSITLRAGTLSGVGTITANGGGASTAVSNAGGGGGRIAIDTDLIDPDADFNGLLDLSAHRGRGSFDNTQGSAGTLYLAINGSETLIIDDNETGRTAATGTPLPLMGPARAVAVEANALTTDGLVPLLPGALVGLRLNPNLTQDETFAITANGVDRIEVATPNEQGVAFATVAAIGGTYIGDYRYGNLLLRRGGHLEVGDLLTVTDQFDLTDYSMLTHPRTTTTYEGGLDLTAGRLTIDATSRIDVSERGYLGGRRAGADDTAHTLGLLPGSQNGTGGSHGGLGGRYSGAGASQPAPVYGTATDPMDLGGGGGGWNGTPGGDGGGRVLLRAGTLLVDGVIRADGGLDQGAVAGAGAGGSLNINVVDLDGSGTISANGGAPALGGRSGVGGGGGRIALHFTGALTLPQTAIDARAGTGNYGNASPGTRCINTTCILGSGP